MFEAIRPGASGRSRLALGLLRSRAVVAGILLGLLATSSVSIAAPDRSLAATAWAPDLSLGQWGLVAANVPTAAQGHTGTGTVIGVIDVTQIDDRAPDLQGRILSRNTVTNGIAHQATSAEIDAMEPDMLEHATHIAGILVAADDGHGVRGVAPDARIVGYAVDGSLTPSAVINDLAAAIRAAAQKVKVISLSLGWNATFVARPDTAKACAAISAATADGVTVVVSAGNDADQGNFPNPLAQCPDAISVTALASASAAAGFTTTSGRIDIAAPGVGIFSTVPEQPAYPDGYATMDGTSMAAPFVAGAAALVAESHPSWTPAQIKEQLTSTSDDLGLPGADPIFGSGRLDVAAALGLASDPRPEIHVPAPQAVLLGADDTLLLTWKQEREGQAATGYDIELRTPTKTFTATARAGASAAVVNNLSANDRRMLADLDSADMTITAHHPSGDVFTLRVLTPILSEMVSAPPPVPSQPPTLSAVQQKYIAQHSRLVAEKDGSYSIVWAVPASLMGSRLKVYAYTTIETRAGTVVLVPDPRRPAVISSGRLHLVRNCKVCGWNSQASTWSEVTAAIRAYGVTDMGLTDQDQFLIPVAKPKPSAAGILYSSARSSRTTGLLTGTFSCRAVTRPYCEGRKVIVTATDRRGRRIHLTATVRVDRPMFIPTVALTLPRGFRATAARLLPVKAALPARPEQLGLAVANIA